MARKSMSEGMKQAVLQLRLRELAQQDDRENVIHSTTRRWKAKKYLGVKH